MSMMKDALIRRMDIAKDTLVPLFAEEFKTWHIEFLTNEELDYIEIMVESNDDIGDKYFRMDLRNAPKVLCVP